MPVRKLIVKAFVREVILYDNAVTITYNFIDYDVPTKVTTEYVENIEQQIESADTSAVSFISSSYNQADFSPRNPTIAVGFFLFYRGLDISYPHALRAELGTPD